MTRHLHLSPDLALPADAVTRKCQQCEAVFARTSETEMQWRVAAKRCASCEREHLKDRIRSKVFIDDNGCWLWQGQINTTGYGRMSVNDHPASVHRVAYEVFVGPVPDEMNVCHRCDVRRCANPSHLFVGTQQDNVDDMKTKGRASDPPKVAGEANHKAVLTDGQVRELRSLHSTGGYTQRELAAMFGVRQSTVWRIIHAETRAGASA